MKFKKLEIVRVAQSHKTLIVSPSNVITVANFFDSVDNRRLQWSFTTVN